MKHAMILAGGKGTRLQSAVSEVPKPMAPVSGKPFLAHILIALARQEFEIVSLLVGYKREAISDYFGSEFHGLQIEYHIDDSELGTGGALKQAFKSEPSPVLVLNGDSYLDFDLIAAPECSSKNLIFCRDAPDTDRYGAVEIDDNKRVTGFSERASGRGFINVGAYYILAPNTIDFPSEKKFSWEVFLTRNFKALDLHAEIYEGAFVDIGIPADYYRLKNMIEMC